MQHSKKSSARGDSKFAVNHEIIAFSVCWHFMLRVHNERLTLDLFVFAAIIVQRSRDEFLLRMPFLGVSSLNLGRLAPASRPLSFWGQGATQAPLAGGCHGSPPFTGFCTNKYDVGHCAAWPVDTAGLRKRQSISPIALMRFVAADVTRLRPAVRSMLSSSM